MNTVPPVLAALRVHTRDAHQALETSLAIASPMAGKADYAHYVAAMWGWMKPLELPLWSQPWPAGLQTSKRAVKCDWLEHDIAVARAAGYLDHRPALGALHAPRRELAARFGCAYVIEGSVLGGAALLQRLGARLAPWPARYLNGYRYDRAALWRTFLAGLAATVRDARDIDIAVDAARDTFASIGCWLVSRAR